MPHWFRALFFPGITHNDSFTEWKLNAFYRLVSTYILAISLPLTFIFILLNYQRVLGLQAVFASGLIFVYTLLFYKRLRSAVHLFILLTSAGTAVFVTEVGFNDGAYWLFLNVMVAAIFINLQAAVIWSFLLTGLMLCIAAFDSHITFLPPITIVSDGAPIISLSGNHLSSVIFLILTSAALSILFKSYFNDIVKKLQNDYLLLKKETKQKELAQEEKLKAEENLHQLQKMEAVGQLAGGVAHDFNNMLAAIGYAAEALKLRYMPQDPKFEKYVNMIISATQRSTDLTKNLLAFSRKGKKQVVVLNIHDTIHDVIQLIEHTIDRRIRVTHKLQAIPSLTMGDKSQLQNALLNLAVNARDAMPNGGRLHFETINHISGSLRLAEWGLSKGDYIEIQVTDTGTGIDEETLRRIFEPFFTTKEEGKGTGLGLAGVYGTLQSHKGTIVVNSELGKGTTFRLMLPLVAETGVHHLEPSGPLIKGKGNILLIDDETVFRESFSDIVSALGYTVIPFSAPTKAIGYYTSNWETIDLIIIDVIMPEMDGFECLRHLTEVNKQLKAAIITGYSADKHAGSKLQENIVFTLDKPVAIHQLAEMLNNVIGKK